MILKGPRISLPDIALHEFVKSKMEFGTAVALIDSQTNQHSTFAQFTSMCEALKHGLRQDGFEKGDIAMICLPTCPECVVVLLAAISLGGIYSGINPQYTEGEIQRAFGVVQPNILITNVDNYDKCSRALKTLGLLKTKVYVLGSELARNSFRALLEKGSKAKASNDSSVQPSVRINPATDVACMLFSSGTTGLPKGVMLTHRNLIGMMHILRPETLNGAKCGEPFLHYLPMFHIYGVMMSFYCLINGAMIITMPSYSPQRFLELIQKYKVRFASLVPPIARFLAKDRMVSEYDISSLDTIMVGAAPIGKDVSIGVFKRLPHLKHLIQGYGLTEITGASHVSPVVSREALKHGSGGRVAPTFESKVVNPETGETLGPNQPGEILIRGPCLMKGYWQNPDATAQTIDENGWLHSGDIGFFDSDGDFYIIDRIKELIKVKAFQVAPAEIEDLLVSHPRIQEAAVVGIPDDVSGEVPIGFVVLKQKDDSFNQMRNYDESTNELLDEAISFVNGKLAPYKRLRRLVPVDELPKTPSGKLLRRLLRNDYVAKRSVQSKL